METVYVVTNPENGWDCVVGVFTDEDYVYGKYSNDKYVISKQDINTTKFETINIESEFYRKNDYTYLFIGEAQITKFDETDDFIPLYTVQNIKMKDIQYLSYMIVDGVYQETQVEFNGIEQKHTIQILSIIADIFCEYTGIEQKYMIIFSQPGCLFLGCTKKFNSNKELWNYFKYNKINIFY